MRLQAFLALLLIAHVFSAQDGLSNFQENVLNKINALTRRVDFLFEAYASRYFHNKISQETNRSVVYVHKLAFLYIKNSLKYRFIILWFFQFLSFPKIVKNLSRFPGIPLKSTYTTNQAVLDFDNLETINTIYLVRLYMLLYLNFRSCTLGVFFKTSNMYIRIISVYRISSYSCRGNYSFLNLSSEETIQGEETIWGNTVCKVIR